MALALLLAGPAAAQSTSRVAALSDAEFWRFFVTMSEPDGYFLSDNFVSNELGFQEVIPTLQRSLTPGGVYLGVGPEQNFTYIANLNPAMAVIFDIRRQNAMQHLMYKALFELSPTRADFVARLFSRPAVGSLPRDIAVKALFDSAEASATSDSAYQANRRALFEVLKDRHRFELSTEDSSSIEQVYRVFYLAGPSINYGYRMGMAAAFRTAYPTFGMLQAATNADSVQTAFLANDAQYATVRGMQLRNLIIPVVGDFGGRKSIRAVGDYLRERQLRIGAFYVSNVEQYLFRDGSAWERFYGNLTSLPLDSTSSFIRSVPRGGAGNVMTFSAGPGGPSIAMGTTSVSLTVVRDSMGIRTITTSRDSAGQFVTRTTRDSSGIITTGADTSLAAQLRQMMARRDSLSRANGQWQVAGGPPTAVVMGGLLTSGLASIQGTLEAFLAGQLTTYNQVIALTRTTGWR